MTEEQWRNIKGYEGLYQVSNKGRVRSFVMWNGHTYKPREKSIILKMSKTTTGYWKVELSNRGKRKSHKVHRLVAAAFILNFQNKPNINHIDNNPLNNNVENLEWCTQSENLYHAGVFSKKRKVPLEEVKKVIGLYKNKVKVREIAKMYNCSICPIYQILKTHNVTIQTSQETKNIYNIDLDLFKKHVDDGKSNKEIQKLFSCSKGIVATRKYQYRKGII